MRKINYKEIINNIDEMANTMEYDAMRSPGKMKLNADVLLSLHRLRSIYETKIPKTPKKKEVNNG